MKALLAVCLLLAGCVAGSPSEEPRNREEGSHLRFEEVLLLEQEVSTAQIQDGIEVEIPRGTTSVRAQLFATAFAFSQLKLDLSGCGSATAGSIHAGAGNQFQFTGFCDAPQRGKQSLQLRADAGYAQGQLQLWVVAPV